MYLILNTQFYIKKGAVDISLCLEHDRLRFRLGKFRLRVN